MGEPAAALQKLSLKENHERQPGPGRKDHQAPKNHINHEEAKMTTFKRMAQLLAAILLLLAVPAQAQTYHTNGTCDASTAQLVCYGSISMGTDSTASHFTPKIYIGDANAIDPADTLFTKSAFIWMDVSEVGTEDVDVFVDYSYDGNTWYELGGTAIKAQQGTTAAYDTLNVINGSRQLAYNFASYLRVEFDGQTMNSGSVITWAVSLPKEQGAGSSTRQLSRAN